MKRSSVDEETTELGRLIQDRRQELNVSQIQLAEAVGCTQQTLSRWEKGRILPPFERLPHLARALQVDPAELFRAASVSAERSRFLPAAERIGGVEEKVASLEGEITELKTMLQQVLDAVSPQVAAAGGAGRKTAPPRQRKRA